MGKSRAEAESRRDAEFAAFTAGAAGRLLHAATLLAGDPAEADRLLTAALAHVYANWFRMRGEDPYERTRSEIVRRFAYRPWWQRARGGTLDRLSGQERLIVTMRFFEGVAEEQTAAQLGLPVERVRSLCGRATATLRSRPYSLTAAPLPAARSVAEARAQEEALALAHTDDPETVPAEPEAETVSDTDADVPAEPTGVAP